MSEYHYNQFEQFDQITMENKEINDQKESKFDDKYRYLICLIGILINCQPSLGQSTVYSLKSQLNKFYDLNEQIILLIFMANPIVFVIAYVPISYQLDHNSQRKTCLIGQIILVTGCFLRLFINLNPFFLVLGQILIAVGNCFIGLMIPKISSIWFQPDHRVFATSLMTSSYMLGNSLGFFLNYIFISSQSNTFNIFYLFFSVLIINFFIFLFFYFFFKDKEQQNQNIIEFQNIDYKSEILNLYSNINYRYLCLFFWIELGTYISISSFSLNIFMIFNKNLNIQQANILGVILNIFATLGKISIGIFFSYKIGFKRSLLFICLIKYLGFMIFLFSLYFETGYYYLIIIYSYFSQMFFGTTLEFGCEIGFPCGEATSSGGLMSGSCIFSFIISQIILIFVNKNSLDSFILFFILNFILVISPLIKIQEKLLRKDYQEKKLEEKN